MKKTLIVLAMVFGAQFASAEMTLLPSSHPVYADESKNGGDRVIIGYISNIDWDKAQAEKAEREGLKLPLIGDNTDITDEAGVVYKNACSQSFVSRHQCVVLTGTKEYRDNMLSIARAIIASGQENTFPRFSGWYKLVK